ncbi:hypothetical protein KKC88_05280 [Patescibacteria group bacterium]|nr:hypothetical protein [Patescibacteria group bacterium]MBU1673599.1 hypothetical protein [Patescibacteria group bacterium]MBU1964039.1 hypothetical protein [Patescibacteria group bacterium]
MEEQKAPKKKEGEGKKSNTVWIVIVIILAVALVAIGAYYFGTREEDKDTNTNNANVVNENKNENANENKNENTNTNANENTNTAPTGWKMYEDSTTGVSFEYPDTAVMGVPADHPNDLTLNVGITKVADLPAEAPLGLDKATAEKDAASLKTGKFGESSDFDVTESQKVIAVGDQYGKEYMVLGRFEVCDVTFERTVIFYVGTGTNYDDYYQVMITMGGPVDAIKKAMPDYFAIDEANCGNEEIWDPNTTNGEDNFYKKVAAGDGSGEAQTWYDDFTKLTESIVIK